MQVIYKSVLAFKNCQIVFRSNSSGALPVLAITGFDRFVVLPHENHRYLKIKGHGLKSAFHLARQGQSGSNFGVPSRFPW